MDIQRLRNLTTGRLHTDTRDIVKDIEHLTGTKGLRTDQLPEARRAMLPWLEKVITDPRFWDGQFDTTHVGEYEIVPMTKAESAACMHRFLTPPNYQAHERQVAINQLASQIFVAGFASGQSQGRRHESLIFEAYEAAEAFYAVAEKKAEEAKKLPVDSL
jgi:hypothetical protein